MVAAQQTICRHFAALLSYPDRKVSQVAAACAELLRTSYPQAVEPLRGFIAFLAAQEAAQVEELFTATFDLQPACHPYVGYQLCGESQQRTLFLMRLVQLYQQHGFSGDVELPDHLATLLRFVGSVADRECGMEIIRDGLLPALDKMVAGLEGEKQPYGELINAVQSFLSETVAAGTGPVMAGSRRS
jgi:nitrate reductase molybdenum cofactor assembly chaperone NarJ/NarW